MSSPWIDRDARVCWHPYTQHETEAEPLVVVGSEGAYLELEGGRRILDGISSWWATLHGHGQPDIARAIAEQTRRLDHVLFAGATHPTAIELAERLVDVTPGDLTRVFFSDDGSTAVEVAIKMVLQRWVLRDQPQRQVLVTLEGGYHGDTFGAMSVGDPDPFFLPFTPFCFQAARVPVTAEAIVDALDELDERAAGVLVEPLIQGAAGMRMHSPELLQEVRAACDERGLPLIADEVMTGFGRTGARFACEAAGIAPDLLCLAKGLTGGMFPMSVTLATEPIFEEFLSPERARAFFHGHTFTANPVGCAAALASLDVLEREDTPAQLEAIGRTIHGALTDLEGHPGVRDLRQRGGAVALDLTGGEQGYLASMAPRLRAAAIERGVLLRPLGNVLYALPPACLTREEALRVASVMRDLVELAT